MNLTTSHLFYMTCHSALLRHCRSRLRLSANGSSLASTALVRVVLKARTALLQVNITSPGNVLLSCLDCAARRS
jgi:hypothetical protein